MRAAKKTSWVELYFDLIFVLAIAQVSHVLSGVPGWHSLWVALGLFVVLWWTWIGFALFYNRYGDEGLLWQRLALIAATVPTGLAAVAVPEIEHGDRVLFTLSLVGARVLLALVHRLREGSLPQHIFIGYTASALAFAASLFLPSPWWWLLWIAAIIGESLSVFASEPLRKPSKEQLAALGKDWRRDLAMFKPVSAEYALNVPHLAERFGLFMIILLGEVVVSAGQSVSGGQVSVAGAAGVLVFAGILWWIYFDAAAQTNERMFELSGGAPQMARSIFAIGRMIPAFALVMVAAGLRLLVEGHPGPAAFWLVSAGLGAYLLGTRVDVGFTGGAWLRLGLLALTFPLGFMGYVVPPLAYLWVLCAWAAICAVATSIGGRLASTEIASPPQ